MSSIDPVQPGQPGEVGGGGITFGPSSSGAPVLLTIDPDTADPFSPYAGHTQTYEGVAVTGYNLDLDNPYLVLPTGWDYANLTIVDGENATFDLIVPDSAVGDYDVVFGTDFGVSDPITFTLPAPDAVVVSTSAERLLLLHVG